MTSDNPDLLTTAEVAAILRTPIPTVQWWRSKGRGPRYFKVGRQVLYDRADLNTFIAEQRRANGGSS